MLPSSNCPVLDAWAKLEAQPRVFCWVRVSDLESGAQARKRASAAP